MNPNMIGYGFDSFNYLYKNKNYNRSGGSFCRDCARFKPMAVKNVKR